MKKNLGALAEPRLIAWASGSTDLDALAKRLQQRTQQYTGPSDGSRVRPDGRKLAWRTLALEAAFARDGIDPIPFFIQWSPESAHPSQDSPSGCDLRGFAIEHPEADRVRSTLAQAGIEADVRQGKSCRLSATLDTPLGRLDLT